MGEKLRNFLRGMEGVTKFRARGMVDGSFSFEFKEKLGEK